MERERDRDRLVLNDKGTDCDFRSRYIRIGFLPLFIMDESLELTLNVYDLRLVGLDDGTQNLLIFDRNSNIEFCRLLNGFTQNLLVGEEMSRKLAAMMRLRKE